MQFVGGGQAVAVLPRHIVVTHAVDYQRVAIPVAYGVAEVARRQIVRMLAAVHVDDAVGHRVRRGEDVDAFEFRHVDNFKAVRRHDLARATGGFAAGVGFAGQEQVVAEVGEFVGPVLDRDVLDVDRCALGAFGFVGFRVHYQIGGAADPETDFTFRRAEVDAAVGVARRWLRRFGRCSRCLGVGIADGQAQYERAGDGVFQQAIHRRDLQRGSVYWRLSWQ